MQLYIKVSEDLPTSQHPSSGDAPTSTSEDTQQGSAMELTDPHLPVLSQYWLAALKDKARLFLPAEFVSQLPPTGGTFYSVDVMDNVKPYYQSNWSSLLHAASIWLQERGFVELERREAKKPSVGLPQPLLSTSGKQRSGSPAKAVDPRLDHFYLILGLGMQSLCLPETLDHPHVISDCLRALQRLLSSGLAQEVLGADSRVSIEILSMLHRLLLTSQLPSTHVMALHIAALVGGILREAVGKAAPQQDHTEADKNGRDSPSSPDGFSKELDAKVPVTPESGLAPGQSCTYALLEVVSCCLLALVPSLRPVGSKPRHTSHPSDSAQLPRKEDLVVVSLSLTILATSGSLCSPEATPSILPPVLHMFLCTLGYVSLLPRKSLDLLPGLPAVALQSLSQFCASLPMSHDLVGAELVDILQSALVSVLGRSRVGVDEGGAKEEELAMSDDTRLVVAAVLLHVPTPSLQQAICPAPSKLFDACVALFERCLQSGDTEVCGCGVGVVSFLSWCVVGKFECG